MLSKYDNFTFVSIRTRIREAAHERGRTVAEIARQLGLYRSNLSAMDAGRRAPSLRLLGRLAEALDCGVGDLLEETGGSGDPVFRSRKAETRLEEREREVSDGMEKGWVHANLLAWQRHYGKAARRRA